MITVAICDDQASCIKEIKKYVDFYFKDNSIEYTVSAFLSGEEIINSRRHFDLAFLDIEMGEMNGIDVGRHLRSLNPKTVIFIITAYDSYLDDAFNLNVFRYLPKSIEPQRLYSSLDAALELLSNMSVSFFDAKCSRLVKLATQDIIFIEIDNRKTKITSVQGIYYSKEKISYWRERLSASYFASPHLSFIVNMHYAVAYNRKILTLGYEKQLYDIPVAPKSQMEFRQRFFNFIDRGI